MWQMRLMCHLELKRWGGGEVVGGDGVVVCDFKGQEGNSHEDGTLNICKHMFAVPSLTIGYGEDLIKRVL